MSARPPEGTDIIGEGIEEQKCIYQDRPLCKNLKCSEYKCECNWEKEICKKYDDGSEHNPVDHPNHYCQGGIECIKAIEAAIQPKGFQDYCKGNVMKYIWRFREKNGIEDLKKARVYLNWMIESAEKELQNG